MPRKILVALSQKIFFSLGICEDYDSIKSNFPDRQSKEKRYFCALNDIAFDFGT